MACTARRRPAARAAANGCRCPTATRAWPPDRRSTSGCGISPTMNWSSCTARCWAGRAEPDAMSLHHQLKRLERAQPPESPLALVCVEEEGRILDDGSDPIRPWIGKHYSDVPGN